jgi:hypothetical protein
VVIAAAACALAAAPARAASEPTPAGVWRFDETGGQTVLDAGPHGLDGRLGPSAASEAEDPGRIPGANGQALRFGGGSFVRLPDTPLLDLQSLTAEAVVRGASSPGQFRYVVSRGADRCEAGSWGLYTGVAGGMAFYVFDGSGYVVSAGARPLDVWDGNWHHVAGAFDGQVLRLFVDGRPVGDPAPFTRRIDYSVASVGTFFGRYAGGCGLDLSGDVDLVRLWRGALSSAAIGAAAAAELHPGRGLALPDLDVPLPAATPPTVIGAPASADPDRPGRPAAPPGAPPRACELRPSRTRVRVNRRTLVRVRVAVRGRPVRAARVIARWRGRSKVIAHSRTGAGGWARLRLEPRMLGRVRIATTKLRPSCAPVHIRVTGAP